MKVLSSLVLLILHAERYHAWILIHQTLKGKSQAFPNRMLTSSDRRFNLSGTIRSESSDNIENGDESKEYKELQISGPEEEECFDLCDIDWDLMPQWSGDEEGSTGQNADASPSVTDPLGDNEGRDEGKDAGSEMTTSKSRIQLEMQWQMWKNEEDCDVAKGIDTCGKNCKECDGRGWQLCRFCHGKGKVYMGDQMMECVICSRARKNRDLVGTEQCRNCRGSGWVASWTNLANRV